MAWLLCKGASSGGAAFAFATANGVKLLAAEQAFQDFLKSAKFLTIIGLDAITDENALNALRKVRDDFPNFTPKLFLHDSLPPLFHPKTVWLRTANGGVTITGSGNLTVGGLRENWEALCIEHMSPTEIDAIEAAWDVWIKSHTKNIRDLDDPHAIEKAKKNKIQRSRIRKILKLPEAEAEAAEEAAEEVVQDLQFPVLIAEVPKSDDTARRSSFNSTEEVASQSRDAFNCHHARSGFTVGSIR